jgi:hypothetical protein
MASLFTFHPKISYDLHKNKLPLRMTDLTAGFKIVRQLQSNYVVAYEYQIKDGDTPENVADRYYGDGSLDWILLLINNMIDPQWDWPLSNNQLNAFIRKKYGSVSNAMGTSGTAVHHYEQILNWEKTSSAGSFKPNVKVPERYLVVDLTTFNTLDPTMKRIVDNFTYEDRLNEKKRSIKILEARYLSSVTQQIESVFD